MLLTLQLNRSSKEPDISTATICRKVHTVVALLSQIVAEVSSDLCPPKQTYQQTNVG